MYSISNNRGHNFTRSRHGCVRVATTPASGLLHVHADNGWLVPGITMGDAKENYAGGSPLSLLPLLWIFHYDPMRRQNF